MQFGQITADTNPSRRVLSCLDLSCPSVRPLDTATGKDKQMMNRHIQGLDIHLKLELESKEVHVALPKMLINGRASEMSKKPGG